jgi:heme/copper-type cytochrome/quinol oxidase subunit 2
MFTVSLNVTDTGSLSDTDDAQMSVQPAGGAAADSTWLIVVLAVIAVVAVLVILFLLLRRKKRGEETPEPGESPPKSTS